MFSWIIIIVLTLLLIYSNRIQIYELIQPYLKPKIKPIVYKSINTPNIDSYKSVISEYIKNDVTQFAKEDKLIDILLYSVDNGKQIRPIILCSIFENLSNQSNDKNHIMLAASAIEYIHSASLIIDDIMDMDTMRRNKPSVYAKYNQTTAQIAASLLCTKAMLNFFHSVTELDKVVSNMNSRLPIILGTYVANTLNDLNFGQYLDVMPHSLPELANNIRNNQNNNVSKKEAIVDVIHKKTSSLFEFCFIIPWLFTNCEKSEDELKEGINKMTKIAQLFGFLFQVSDDFEDMEQDKLRDGKNLNYVNSVGFHQSVSDFKQTMEEFTEECKKLNIFNKVLEEALEYLDNKIVSRTLNVMRKVE